MQILKGWSTAEQVEQMARLPGARVCKLISGSCTELMKRPGFEGGKRWTIFQCFDEEPLLSAAIATARRNQMRIKGPLAYWDIRQALERGAIEIRTAI